MLPNRFSMCFGVETGTVFSWHEKNILLLLSHILTAEVEDLKSLVYEDMKNITIDNLL